MPAGDRLSFRLVCTSWAKAGAAVAAVPPGEEPLPRGKVTRTRGADAAASVARAEAVLGVLKGPARERFKSGLCAYAAEGGHLEVLQWARAQGCPWDWRTCAWAARNGHLEVLQWARAHGCRWDEATCAYAGCHATNNNWGWFGDGQFNALGGWPWLTEKPSCAKQYSTTHFPDTSKMWQPSRNIVIRADGCNPTTNIKSAAQCVCEGLPQC